MSYVRGTENGFKGFGEVPGEMTESERAIFCKSPVNRYTPDCQLYNMQIEERLNALYAGAKKQLEVIAGQSPVFAAALAGAKNPGKILRQAENLSMRLTGSDADKEAYRLYYMYGRSGLDMLDSYAGANPSVHGIVQSLKVGTEFSLESYPKLKTWADKIAEGNVDHSTVADGFDLSSRAVVAARKIANAFGQGEAAGVIQEVADYLSIAGGCVAMVGAGAAAGGWGAVGGAVGCGVSILVKVFDKIFGGDPPPDPYRHMFAAFQPGQSQDWVEVIAKDAQRLAAILKYHYKISSYEVLQDAMFSKEVAVGDIFYEVPGPGTNQPVPGWSFRELLMAAWVTSTSNPVPYHLARTPIEMERAERGEGQGAGSGIRYWNLVTDRYGEPSVSAPRFWNLTAPAIRDVVLGATHAANAGPASGPGATQAVRIYEWINFFAALTKQEKRGAALFTYRRPLPVRLRYAFDKRTGKMYSGRYWTSYTDDWMNGDTWNLANKLNLDNDEAYMVLGALRLLSAFSYMHLQYNTPNTVTNNMEGGEFVFGEGRDLIAEVPDFGQGVSTRIPVNPRSPVVNGKYELINIRTLASRMGQRRQRLLEIERKAKRDALDVYNMELSSKEVLEEKGLLTTSGMITGSELKQQIEERGGFQLVKDIAPINVDVLAQQLLAANPGMTREEAYALAIRRAEPLAPISVVKESATVMAARSKVSPVAVIGAAALLGLYLFRR